MDDHIRALGDFGSVRYAHASHFQVPKIRVDFSLLFCVKMRRTLVQKQDLWSAIKCPRQEYALFLPAGQ